LQMRSFSRQEEETTILTLPLESLSHWVNTAQRIGSGAAWAQGVLEAILVRRERRTPSKSRKITLWGVLASMCQERLRNSFGF
jgi:hypothetical protein